MDALTGKLLASRFQLFERLDDRGAALTYRGQDRRLGAACRVIVPKLEARAAFGSFERTWRLLGSLRCPHLAQLVDQGRLTAGRPYVVFRWIEGRTLDQIIRAEGAQPAARAAAITRAALLALREAHGNGIVHRDVTCANVVIGHGPDAGAIKLVGFAGAPRDAIDARAMPGDPIALAPERFADPTVVTPIADLYAVGVLLFTLLAGRPPFDPRETTQGDDAETRLRWLHTHAHPTRPNTGVPDALWRFTLSLLEKRPQDRPQGADRALADLDAALGNRSLPPPFVTGDAGGDPFDSGDALDSLGSLESVGSIDDPFSLAEDPTVADPGPIEDDDDEEPTVQQSGLAVAASLMFGGDAPAVDPFARTGPIGDGRSTQDALDSLVGKDPLAIEAEHDSVNSDILDELTLPDRARHLRAMLRPRPSTDGVDDEQPTRQLLPEPPVEPSLPPVEPAASPRGASGEGQTRPLPPTARQRDYLLDEPAPKTRPSRPGNRAALLPSGPDPLARVPDVSAFSDPDPDEVSTIAVQPGARRPRPGASPHEQATPPARPAAAASVQQPGPAATPAPAATPRDAATVGRQPLNLAAQSPNRLVGVAIAIAALLALVGGVMWFTSGDPAPSPDAAVAPQTVTPVKIGN